MHWDTPLTELTASLVSLCTSSIVAEPLVFNIEIKTYYRGLNKVSQGNAKKLLQLLLQVGKQLSN